MGRLISYLKSAAAKVQLSGPLGRWMQAVSDAADVVANPSYIEVRRATSNQSVNFSNADDIILNDVVVDGGIVYDPVGGVFTLDKGLYELAFYGTWVNFGTPNVTAATVEWVDAPTGTVPLAAGCGTWAVSSTSTLNNAGQPVTRVLYLASAGDTVKLKATVTGGGGTADLQRGSSYAIVRKLS